MAVSMVDLKVEMRVVWSVVMRADQLVELTVGDLVETRAALRVETLVEMSATVTVGLKVVL